MGATDRTLFIRGIVPSIQEIRRDLHKHPELAFHEFRTQAVVLREMESLGIPAKKVAPTGVIAKIKGTRKGRTVALRADMDALPMPDESDTPYHSIHPGVCHACGHDAHTAILLGVARTLKQSADFAGEVRLVFQPSEEQLPGGAPLVLSSKELDDVDAIFGLHVWQGLPLSHVATTPGPMMAAPDDFVIRVAGLGGHASMPQATVDPIVVAAHMVTALQSIVSRMIDVHDKAVISITQIHAGTAMNVIPETAEIKGTVRTLSARLRDTLPKRMETIVHHVAEAFGAHAQFEFTRGYPPLVNHPSMAEFALKVARELCGADLVHVAEPVMGGEDFAYYLEKIPGAFLWIGMGTPYPHHHPKFDANDEVLAPAIALMSELAIQFLENAPGPA